MFNGIIFNKGTVTKIEKRKKGINLFLQSGIKLSRKDLGVSKDKINLELPLKFGQNISGHICQGHVDTVCKVKKIRKIDKSLVFEFKISKDFKKLLVEKASILINGVSLTISKIKKESFEIWVIPHTLKLTNLSNIIQNDFVNVEIDILSKYTKKFINEKK